MTHRDIEYTAYTRVYIPDQDRWCTCGSKMRLRGDQVACSDRDCMWHNDWISAMVWDWDRLSDEDRRIVGHPSRLVAK